MLSVNLPEDVLHQLLITDYLVLMSATNEGLRNKFKNGRRLLRAIA